MRTACVARCLCNLHRHAGFLMCDRCHIHAHAMDMSPQQGTCAEAPLNVSGDKES